MGGEWLPKSLVGESFYPVHDVTGLMMGPDRTSVLARAISETVQKGDLVVDLGAGTGILSVLAAMAGAEKVVAVEINPNSLALAREIIKKNRLEGKIQLVGGNAFEFKMKERADVAISETISSTCFLEQVIPLMQHARKHLLKKGGKTIPEKITIMCAPIENEKLFSSASKTGLASGVLLPDLQFLSSGLARWRHVEEGKILAEPKAIKEIDFGEFRERKVKGTADFVMERKGKLHSFFAFLVIRFSGGTELNSLECKGHWQPRFFFLEKEQQVEEGDRVSFSLEFEPCNALSLRFSAEKA